ncbi:MAG: hypothetical protein D6766_01055 [Verrucomicrobia bacterium]|nr:MAG: hypothetical protein D6766_01055 [Verrucomicrobiota bacterium]
MLDADGWPVIFELPGGPVTLRFTTGAGDVDWFTLSPVGTAVVAATPAPDSTVPRNTSLDFTIRNFNSTVDPASIRLVLDGEDVTAHSAVAVTADGATVHHDPGLFEKETSHSYELTFQDDADPPRAERFTGTFQTSPLGGPGVFVIEAEDFDFDAGQHKPEADVMPYLGGAYEGLGAVYNVDYRNDGRPDNDLYRAGEDPNMPMVLTVAPETKQRGDWTVDPNYALGWPQPGGWQNYTRNIPAGLYEVFAAMSHDGTADHARRSQLGLVVAGQGTETQTVIPLGVFDAPGSGDWDAYPLIPLTDGADGRVVVDLPGTSTLRWTEESGNLDYLVLYPAGPPPAPVDALIRVGTDASRPFKLDDVYQTIPAGEQVAEQTVANRETAVFQVLAQNDGDAPRRLSVRAAEQAVPGWVIRYRAASAEAGSDITAGITGPTGYLTVELAPGESETLTVEMTPQPVVPGGDTAFVELSVSSDPRVQPGADVVRAVTHVALTTQPDLMIANHREPNFAGERVFNLDTVRQTRYQALPAGVAAWFDVLLENHGNGPGAFLLQGTPVPSGASVRYVAPRPLLNFDGTSGWIGLGGWNAGSQWTLEAWVRPSALPG